jgi:hypothetical protein
MSSSYLSNPNERSAERQRTKKHLSLGCLFKNQNTANPRAPALVGKLTITPETFRKLIELFERNGGSELEVQLAAWYRTKSDGSADYLSVQLSEPYERPKEKPAKPKPTDLSDFINGSKGNADEVVPPWQPSEAAVKRANDEIRPFQPSDGSSKDGQC